MDSKQFVGGLVIDSEGNGLFDFKRPADAELQPQPAVWSTSSRCSLSLIVGSPSTQR